MLKQVGFTLICTSLLLAGCGGGGGDDDSSSNDLTYDGPTAGVVVSSEAEADTLAGTIIAMETDSSSLLNDATNVSLPGLSVSSEGSGSIDINAISDITRKLSKSAFTAEPASSTLAGISKTTTLECDPYGGTTGTASLTETLSEYDEVNDWTPTNGDSFHIIFNNCFMDSDPYDELTEGQISNGEFLLVLTDVSSLDPTAENPTFEASYNFNNLSSHETATNETAWIGGSFSAGFSGDGITTPLTFAFSGDSLIVQQQSGGITESAQLSNFSFFDTVELDGSFTFDHDYEIASTELGGSVTVNMTTPFTILAGDDYPSSGVAEITFANGAVRLTANDSTQVYLEYDLDGVPGYESNQTKLWTAL